MDILLDMDGVLTDFVEGVGRMYDKDLYERWEYGKDIPELLGVTENEFRSLIASKKQFWTSLKPYPWAADLYKFCKDFTNTLFLSAPMKNDHKSAGQKIKWIEKHIKPDITPFDYILTGRKTFVARSDRILIDDFDENIDKWEKYGGIGILFPRPWNTLFEHSESAFEYTKNAIEQLF